MLERFDILKNQFLTKDIVGYHSLYYSGYKTPENPDFLNVLKNTFDNEPVANLHAARRMVENILLADIPSIAEYIKRCSARRSCISVCVPRAKALNTYTSNQMFLKDAIQEAVRQIPIITDGTDVIIRHTNTRTTHLRETVCRVSKCGQEHSNDGERPYPGITKETCHINADMIRDQNVILIDDIYTNGVNIDEDCIQALFDSGAKGVMFYAIAYTRR